MDKIKHLLPVAYQDDSLNLWRQRDGESKEYKASNSETGGATNKNGSSNIGLQQEEDLRNDKTPEPSAAPRTTSMWGTRKKFIAFAVSALLVISIATPCFIVFYMGQSQQSAIVASPSYADSAAMRVANAATHPTSFESTKKDNEKHDADASTTSMPGTKYIDANGATFAIQPSASSRSAATATLALRTTTTIKTSTSKRPVTKETPTTGKPAKSKTTIHTYSSTKPSNAFPTTEASTQSKPGKPTTTIRTTFSTKASNKFSTTEASTLGKPGKPKTTKRTTSSTKASNEFPTTEASTLGKPGKPKTTKRTTSSTKASNEFSTTGCKGDEFRYRDHCYWLEIEGGPFMNFPKAEDACSTRRSTPAYPADKRHFAIMIKTLQNKMADFRLRSRAWLGLYQNTAIGYVKLFDGKTFPPYFQWSTLTTSKETRKGTHIYLGTNKLKNFDGNAMYAGSPLLGIEGVFCQYKILKN